MRRNPKSPGAGYWNVWMWMAKRSIFFFGKSKVLAVDEETLTLEHSGKVFKARRKVSSPHKIERLTFSWDDFFTDDGDYKYEDEAGTFDCTVVEALGDSDLLKKLWMINDRVGIYARIIQEDPDETFGHYAIYELKEIKTVD